MKTDEMTDQNLGAWWEIPHPGTLARLRCATFEEAMKWFEGFNLPVLVVDGQRESLQQANERVRKFYNTKPQIL